MSDQSVLSTAEFIIKSISEDAQQVVAVYLKFPTTLMIQAGQQTNEIKTGIQNN